MPLEAVREVRKARRKPSNPSMTTSAALPSRCHLEPSFSKTWTTASFGGLQAVTKEPRQPCPSRPLPTTRRRALQGFLLTLGVRRWVTESSSAPSCGTSEFALLLKSLCAYYEFRRQYGRVFFPSDHVVDAHASATPCPWLSYGQP